MLVYKSLPKVKITVHNTHEEWAGLKGPKTITPAVHKMKMGRHAGTHIDVLNHMVLQYREQSIDWSWTILFHRFAVKNQMRDRITSKGSCNI